MVRKVNPAHQADREACLAAHPCNICAWNALQHHVTWTGFKHWLALQPTVRPDERCEKHPARGTYIKPPKGQDPAPAPGLDRDPYVRWLQDALRRERSETIRLRRYLNSAIKSMTNAVERPQENTMPTAAPSPYVSPRPIPVVDLKDPKPRRRNDVSDDDAPGDDFDPTSPLSGSEQVVLHTIHGAGGRISSTAMNDVILPRRAVYGACMRLKRRGLVEARLNIGGGLDPRSSTYALTPAGATAVEALPPPLPRQEHVTE